MLMAQREISQVFFWKVNTGKCDALQTLSLGLLLVLQLQCNSNSTVGRNKSKR